MNGKAELSVDEIAEMGISRQSFKGIPGSPRAHGKAGIALSNPTGVTAEKARGGALAEAASEGRVIVNPKAGVDSVMRAINEKFDDSFICDKFREVLDAKKTIVGKDGSVNTSPDHATQVRALELLLKYRVGLPVQRTEITAPKADSSAENLRAKLAASPALRRAFRDTLDRLDTIEADGEELLLTEGEELQPEPGRRAATSRSASKYDGVRG